MNIERLKEAHDLSLDGRDFAARQIILDVIADLEKKETAEQPAPATELREQEPAAWYRDEDGIRIYYESKVWDDATPLYTSPPAQRKPLTRPQINQMMADAGWQNSAIRQADLDKVEKVARAIEAAHGIKENT